METAKHRTTHLIAVSHDPDDPFALLFNIEVLVDDPSFNVEQVVRDAAAEYCETPEGQKEIRWNSGAFNFGDAVNMPDDICKKYGFRITGSEVLRKSCGLVDHDDDLIP